MVCMDRASLVADAVPAEGKLVTGSSRAKRQQERGRLASLKAEIREAVLSDLVLHDAVRFPSRQNRVPNFDGAERAAQRLSELAVWRRARVMKVGSDAPQLAVRRAALNDGKVLYLAVPRLEAERCFIELDPGKLGSRVALAASLRGALRYGRLISPRDMDPIDLVVCGSVAACRDGSRLGGGRGYSDLEYGLLCEEAKVRESAPIVTTLHPLQLAPYEIPMFPHDVPVDYIVTPVEVLATRSLYPRPRGLYWDLLSNAKINAIPALRRRMRQTSSGTRNG